MALAQALRLMPVGALHVRFPKQLDAALGKPPRTCKEHRGGSKLVPLMVSKNGRLAMAGFGVLPKLVMVGVGGGALATTLMVRPLETGHSPCCGRQNVPAAQY